MYTAFYNLKSKPFQISSDPAFIWLGEKHREALATLKYGILDNKGFMLLTGDVGTGKTTLINTLINSLNDDILYASVPDPRLSLNDFLNYIARAFGIEGEFESKGKFLAHFGKFLEDAYDRKKKVLLLIDESQLLTQDLLEEIRLLSNIQKDGNNLLNIFFIGQDEFNEILSRTENRAVAQRLTLNYHLVPLTAQETKKYILHRLKVAGAKQNLFTAAAVGEIYAYSEGFPRRINIICDHCLLTGYVQEKKVVDAVTVQKSALDLKIPQYVKRSPPPAVSAVPQQPVEQPPAAVAEPPPPVAEQVPLSPAWMEKSRSLLTAFLVFLVLGAVVVFFVVPQETLISTREHVTGRKVSAENDKEHQGGAEKQDAGKKKDNATAARQVSSTESAEQVSKQESAAADDQESVVVEVKTAEPVSETAPETAIRPEAVVEVPAAVEPAVAEPAVVEQAVVEQAAAAAEGEKKAEPAEENATVQPELPVVREEELPNSAGGKSEQEVSEKDGGESASSPPASVSANTGPEEKKTVYEFPDKTVMVRFEHNSSDFYFTDLEHIDDFVQAITSHPDAVLVISGHTDSKGSESYNHRLSLFRANMIRSFFLGRGVRPYQLKVQGFGSTRPLTSNDTVAGRRMNRRVEIDVLR